PGVGAPDALPSTGIDDWFRNKCDRLWGLASGRGVYENISQAYLFLMKHYQPGDQIYLFGFSRGAFTVRCLSGMVHLFGIIDQHHEAMLPTLLRVYFSAKEKTSLFRIINDLSTTAKALFGIEAPQEINNRDDVAKQIRINFGSGVRKEAPVYFVGVWDTVSSVGFPGFAVSMSSNPNILSKRIQHVRHALALDEHRRQFKPRVYEQNDFGDATQAQSMRQLWFSGNHCDVGGGYAEKSATALSDQTWRWMLDEARQCGLSMNTLPQIKAQEIRIHDETYSMPWWALLGLSHRQTASLKAIDHLDEPTVLLKTKAAADPGHLRFPEQSIWQNGRAKKSLLMAVLGSLFFSLLYGVCLENSVPKISMGFQETSQLLLDAWRQAWAMSEAQLLAALHPVSLAEYKHAAHPFAALLVADTGLIASYSFLLSRLVSWAFAHRMRFTTIGLSDKLANIAGRLLPLLVAADLLENATTLFAMHHDSFLLNLAVSLLAVTKFSLFVATLCAAFGLRILKR
ncbi:MAG: phospholipase effector Tle1 domain-containing protein, partial [Methylococcales bacterium]